MLVYRQGVANGRLYRKAVHASQFLACPVRSLLEVNSLYIFLNFHIFIHYFLIVT
jgi:hypothetical protein